jgi:hypothetical protein
MFLFDEEYSEEDCITERGKIRLDIKLSQEQNQKKEIPYCL